MKIQMAFVGWFVLLGYFLSSASWADNQNVFPIKDPLVTGTFMEYRPRTNPHFHGGVDLIPKISNQSNNTVRPVAKGKLYYERSGNTYIIRIKHPSDADQYANLVTRYYHVGEYPGASLHGEDVGRDVTTDDILGTIDTPHDGIGDHLHFEVLADYIDASSRNVPDGASYINPLSKLPSIQDASVNYATADDGDPWTWTILDNTFGYLDVDVTSNYQEPEGIPETFRLLFEGFDRINTEDLSAENRRHLSFYSITARFIEKREDEEDPTTLLQWIFTADRLLRRLYFKPHYLFNDENSVLLGAGHRSTESQFYYRLFAHDEDNDLSISLKNEFDQYPDFTQVDEDGYLNWANYGISKDRYFEVVVADFFGNETANQLGIRRTNIGDFLHAFTAEAGTRQVTLNWNFSTGGNSWNHFKIQRSQDGGVSFTDLATVSYEPSPGDGCLHPSTDPEKPGCNFEYVDETATKSINYYYKILTGELVGETWSTEDEYGPPTWEVWARPNGGDPVLLTTRPTELRAEAGDGQVTLRWNVPAVVDPTITGWQYRTKLASATQWRPRTYVSGRATREALVSGLAHGVRHQFEVRAFSTTASKGGPASDVASVALMTVAFSAASYTAIESGNPVGPQEVGGQAPDPPQAAKQVAVIVKVTPATDRSLTIPVTVTAGSAEATDYRVEGLSSGDLNLTAGQDAARFTITARSDEDVDDETIAVGFGTSLPVGVRLGATVSATVTLYDTPSAPTGLTAQGGNASVRLSWDDAGNSGITGWQYQMRRGTRGLWGEWLNMNGSGATTTAYTVAGLVNGESYWFKVRAFNARGRGAESSGVAARVGVPPAPALEAVAGDEQVVLTWQAPLSDGGSPILRYKVRYFRADFSDERQSSWSVVPGDAAARGTTIGGLTNGTAYLFRVLAENGVGNGARAEKTATPEAPSCPITGPPQPTVAENTPTTEAVATYTISGDDCGAAEWLTLGGTDASAFALQGSGTARTLHFVTAPNYETKRSYKVTVRLQVGSAEVLLPVKVLVSNVDEAGTVAVSPPVARVGHSLTATLTDLDGQVTGASWTWEREEGATWVTVWPSGASGTAAASYPELSSYKPQSADIGHRLRASVS